MGKNASYCSETIGKIQIMSQKNKKDKIAGLATQKISAVLGDALYPVILNKVLVFSIQFLASIQ